MPGGCRGIIARAGCALAALLACTSAPAAVTLDGSLGAAGALAGPNYVVNASHGRQVGANLFHSFGVFNLLPAESATFNNSGATGGISNIISRVTGGASSINGALISTVPGANLYLINPAGIVFGPNATLNVSGSFFASTAHYIKHADGARFDAVAPANSVLTAASPAAFGFLSAPAPISVQALLSVPQGKSLGIIGGDLALTGATLRAQGGKLYLGSAAAAGEALPGANSLDMSSIPQGGSMSLSGGALDANEPAAAATGGGAVYVRGGRLTLANTAISTSTVNGHAGGVDIAAGGDFSMSGGQILTVTTGAGNAGPVSINAGRIAMSAGAIIDSSPDPGSSGGNGGAIRIAASESFAIVGNSFASGVTGIVSNTAGPGQSGAINISAPVAAMNNNAVIQSGTLNGVSVTGPGNSVVLQTGALGITGGAQIDSTTHSNAAGGSVQISAELLSISGAVPVPGGTIASGITVNAYGSGPAGQINLNVGTLHVAGGGEISSESRPSASGAGGRINISTANDVVVGGADASGKPSAIVASAFGSGDAGTIAVTARGVHVDGGRIRSQTQGSGNGGDINLNVSTLAIANGGQIAASTFSTGDGGAVAVVASQSVSIAGANAGIFAESGTVATGHGGAIRISTPQVLLSGGGAISSLSSNSGNAGDVNVLGARSVMLDAATITTEALQADGGNITIQAADLVSLNNSRITATVGGGLGNGGNITIDPLFVTLNHSDIIANAFGGNGGNITIVAGNLYFSPDSVISASSRFGLTGTVVISSQTTDLSGGLRALPSDYLDASRLLAERCAARLAGKASSFVVAGRGALPPEPSGLQPSALGHDAAPAGRASSGAGAGLKLAAFGGFGCAK